MKNSDKIIVAFLVSVGIFSGTQASKYVGELSSGKKKSLMAVVKKSDGKILICSGVWDEKNQNNDSATIA